MSPRTTTQALKRFALGLPEAKEEFPWGESVVKVKKKIFVFLGMAEASARTVHLTVKLPESGQDVLDHPFAKPTGYGLGKAGWVSMKFEGGDHPPLEVLQSWILESYRAVAPKKLAAALDAAGPPTKARKTAKTAKTPQAKKKPRGKRR
jgi:predicted DNA-binding protein (MmcQ/YjbR family)